MRFEKSSDCGECALLVVARGHQCHMECRQSAEIVLKSAESVEIGWLTVQIAVLRSTAQGLSPAMVGSLL